MHAEKLETAHLGRRELPQPVWVAAQPRLSVNLDLRQIMVSLVYFAVVSLVGREVYQTGSPLSIAGLGVGLGFGLMYFGIWLACRLGRLAFLGWLIFLIGYCAATGSMMGLLAIPTIPVVVGVIIYLHVQNRRNQQNGLLWVLAVASDRGIPLAPGVEAFAQQNEGIFRERCSILAGLLQLGKPLSAAIAWLPRVVPWDAPLLIRVGEQTGRLPQALREAAETRARRRDSLRNVYGRVGYLIAVVGTAEGIVGFCVYFIVPKFEAIFQDFGVNLPPATVALIQVSRFAGEYSFFVGLGEFTVLAYLAFAVAGRGLQGLPILGRLFRLRHKALLLRTLALVVEANQPVAPAFEVLAREYPSRSVRRRLQYATRAISTGESWIKSLRAVGLLSTSDVGLLDAATRAGNLTWALRALAETGERRFAYRLQIGSHLVFVTAVLLLGVLVLGIAVALFTPLVALIERLS